jgi:hypothetical protein
MIRGFHAQALEGKASGYRMQILSQGEPYERISPSQLSIAPGPNPLDDGIGHYLGIDCTS